MRYLPLFLAAAPAFAQADPLLIVTDIPAMHSLVTQITGDRAEVSVLLDPNADPHHFQLRPSHSREIANADTLIWVGEELTPWLARAHEAIASDTTSLELLDAALNGHEDEGDHSDEHEDDHDHGGINPHVWLGVHETESMLHEIAEHLAEIDPGNSDFYESNAHDAIERLEGVEATIDARFERIRNVPFVVGHDAYGYFVNQFGLNQVETLADIHNSDASVKHMSELSRMAQNGEIVCVFPEVGESDKLAKVLVEGGVRMGAFLDPAGVTLELGPELHNRLLFNLANDIADCLES